ncbi:hypothetical protein H6G81_19685 [Scytonema hofmannii FACHB-248]|uniref:Uncharacterized protein n=1 Tax=Scytonema hofmannii FACHB-248 TaxID=1842502 RepID=A0ABR8GT84_9CYAN|nr:MULTISPECIES: hypothetical protein [Nostocales]MBD2606694.1 hypothetical protein [Scytonema hofmannii FACHB-248]
MSGESAICASLFTRFAIALNYRVGRKCDRVKVIGLCRVRSQLIILIHSAISFYPFNYSQGNM